MADEFSTLDELMKKYGDTLTTGEVAELLQVSVKSVRIMLTTGQAEERLPGYRLGKSWIIVASEFQGWLRSRRNV